MAKQNGLWVESLDVDKFIRLNNIPEVTDPIYLDRNSPTPGGVLSNELFGVTQYDRKNRFGYIDLAPYHYMLPLAAQKIASYDRTLADCLFARGKYVLGSDGTLIEDDENGDAGPEFLYKIWGKVKVKEKTTTTTKEIQTFYEQPREKLFITKFPVIPPFYRDINYSSNSLSKSSNILNSYYSSIISYTQSMRSYTDTFSSMTQLTQARVQTIMMEVYQQLMINQVKGSPSKFGMLRRSLAGKNIPYTGRLVITACNMNRSSLERVPVKFGYATVPLDYICSIFFPFIVHDLKAYFDAQFIQGGKTPAVLTNGEPAKPIVFRESFDENEITSMINRFLNSPGSRFDPVMSPPDINGKRYPIMVTGRFNKNNTSFSRQATMTDILYIVAFDTVADKHVFVTRYPLDNPNGQFPARIIISTTFDTEPVTIGNRVYEFYPIIKGDPMNVFMSSMQFSNTMLGPMGGDLTNTVEVPAGVIR